MSGSVTITPGRQFSPGELETRAGLNQLGRPEAQVDENAITERELAQAINDTLSVAAGKNLLCNGDFELVDYFLAGSAPLTGVISGGHDHDYGAANRWVTTNDANRSVNVLPFAQGQTNVPDSPAVFLRWLQTGDLAIDPSYLGQRLENVRRLSGRTVTISIWVNPTADLTLTPSVRQYFGVAGSADVTLAGNPVMVPANIWTKVVSSLAVPSIAGKTLTSRTFTEIRLQVPLAMTFQIDFAHAQLEFGSVASRFEPKSVDQDYFTALRYYEILNLVLSTSIAAWVPFLNSRVPLSHSPVLTLIPFSGTGGAVGSAGVGNDCFVQTNNHSAIVNAQLIVNAELYG